ncbi:MAG: nickel-dependent hydrogenase large subunit [Atribacterota bacterium]|nr:nickel-dependent hydrogenase large subunit [Atribacterota bacterium]MDD4895287.1 nickel-dependent hydrogenase large subunit [Atribacterota bacterium]MDD5636611.1 nickel-dependent hydrogenase large subunit [Atribacterota bacterium]
MSKSTYKVPIGPIHPSLEEPMTFNFEISGERIQSVDLAPGDNHRGIEFMGRNRNIIQIIYLAERICGICSASHPFAFCRAVENAAGIEVPPRAEYIRVIISELERIHSHILWAGVAAHELGFDSVLFLSWKVREEVMDLLEMLTGNRVNYGMFMIGGVRRDITEQQIPWIRKTLQYYKDVYQKLEDVFLKDPSIALRTKNVGILTYEEALNLASVGPTTRASGVKKDIRQDQPYSAYADFDVQAITPDSYSGEVNGDVFDRIIVRILEVFQSVQIIEYCINNLPDGEILSEPKIAKLLGVLKKVKGEGVGRHEAPRGEVIHYVKLNESENPEVWKARAPTYNNLMSWMPMLQRQEVADIPIVIASIDPCIGCMDRVTLVDSNTYKKQVLTREELRKLSIEKTRRMLR